MDEFEETPSQFITRVDGSKVYLYKSLTDSTKFRVEFEELKKYSNFTEYFQYVMDS